MYADTRINNPPEGESMAAKGKLSIPERKELLAKMAGPRQVTGGSSAIPGSSGALTRPSNPRKPRTKNPDLADTKVAGTSLKDLVTEGLAVLGGVLGGAVLTRFVSSQLVARVSGKMQAVGWTIGGLGAIVLGHLAKRKLAPGFPLDIAGYVASALMLETAAEQFGVPGFAPAALPAPAPVPAPEVTSSGTLRGGSVASMRGTLQPGIAPGTAAGTFRRGAVASMGRGLLRRLR